MGARRVMVGLVAAAVVLAGCQGPPSLISQFAGSGVVGSGGDGTIVGMEFVRPAGLTRGSEGQGLMVADAGAHRVRRIAAGDPTATVVAGNGQRGFSGDGGPATAARLDSPHDLAPDPVLSGDLFIADTGNNRIRRIDEVSGNIETIAGTGAAASAGDGGPAPSAALHEPIALQSLGGGQNTLLVVERGGHRVRAIELPSGPITTIAGTGTAGLSGDGGPATAAQLNNPTDIAVDLDGNIFVADTGNHAIRRIDAGTGTMTTVAGTGIAGYSGDDAAATSAQLDSPAGVTVDDAGWLWISDTGNHRVRVVADGTIGTIAGDGTAGPGIDGIAPTTSQLWNPTRLLVDANGLAKVSDAGASRIRLIEFGALVQGTVRDCDGLPAPAGTTVNGFGETTTTDAEGRFTLAVMTLAPLASPGGPLNHNITAPAQPGFPISANTPIAAPYRLETVVAPTVQPHPFACPI